MEKPISFILAVALCLSLAVSVFAESVAEEIDYTTGTPWLNVDLDGNVTADTPTDPKDNYALWANKETILGLEIAEGEVSAGNTTEMVKKADRDTKAMFHGEVPENPDARLAYDYYYLLTDWDARNALGIAPLKEMIDKVEAIDTLNELTAYLIDTPSEQRLFWLWKAIPNPDPEDSSHNTISLKAAPFLLSDPAEYREMTPAGETAKDAYAEYYEKMLVKLGYSEEDAKQKFENCFLWETKLNVDLASRAESRRSDFIAKKNYFYTRNELMAVVGDLPVLETLEQEGYPEINRYHVPEPAFLENLSELYTEENLPLMRDYLILEGIRELSDRLDWESLALIEEYSNAAEGYPYSEYDQKAYNDSDAYTDVKGALGWAVARFYVENFSDPEDKERITKLVDEIVNAYYGVLEDADFISDETRAGAYEKLDNLCRNVLYPDSWEPYSYDGLSFASKEEGGNCWDAYIAIRKYEHDKAVATFSDPIDRTIWDSYPYTVNCFYTPYTNSIYIMAAYAQGSTYYKGMTEEEFYGKVGVGVAHEISHAFDAVGAQFDKDGNFADWWTKEDYAAFLEKNEKLAAYFDAIHPWEGQDLDGDRMKGEACADMGALRCLLRIAAQKPDFDYDTFFRAYADRCACKETIDVMLLIRLDDEHPMNYLRVNTNLQQFDEFLNFYGITEGDNMYLAPEDRVAIW